MIEKIISGGQAGAELAALDVAIELGIPHGGWIPKGRGPENGILPERYPLSEMLADGCVKGAEQHVLNSDGTLILSHGKLAGRMALTRKLAKKHVRPWIHLEMDIFLVDDAVRIITSWIRRNRIRVLT